MWRYHVVDSTFQSVLYVDGHYSCPVGIHLGPGWTALASLRVFISQAAVSKWQLLSILAKNHESHELAAHQRSECMQLPLYSVSV
jgi:hypothetical protein